MRKLITILLALSSLLVIGQQPFYGNRDFVSLDTQDTLTLTFEGNTIRLSSTDTVHFDKLSGYYINAGMYGDSVQWTNVGTDSILVHSTTVRLYDNPYYQGPLKQVTIPADTFLLESDALAYIGAFWNNGNPRYEKITERTGLNLSDGIPILTVYRQNGDRYYTDWLVGDGLVERMFRKDIFLDRYERQNGLLLDTLSTLGIQLSAGTIWQGPRQYDLSEFKSNNDTMFWYYYDGANWQYTDTSQIVRSVYNTDAGLQTLGAQKFVSVWFFRLAAEDNHVLMLADDAEYTKLEDAIENNLLPSNLPNIIRRFSIFVGRIVVQKNATTVEQIDTPFGVISGGVSSAGAFEHNNLTGIFGESPYYHLNTNDYDLLTSITETDTTNWGTDTQLETASIVEAQTGENDTKAITPITLMDAIEMNAIQSYGETENLYMPDRNITADTITADVIVGSITEFDPFYAADSADIFFQQDTLSDNQVFVDTIGTPLFNSVQEYINLQSSGRIYGGQVTEFGGDSLIIAAGEGMIKDEDLEYGTSYFFSWDEDTVGLTPNIVHYVGIRYNAGNPEVYTSTSSEPSTTDEFYLAKAYLENTETHTITNGIDISSLGARIHTWSKDVFGEVTRASGLLIAEEGTRNFSLTQGVLYAGFDKNIFPAFNTNTGSTFTYYYRDAVDGWIEVFGSTQIDNANYDNGSGTLEPSTPNQFVNHWVYADYDNNVEVVYGQQEFGKLGDAEAAQPPSDLPTKLTNFGLWAGQIIIETNATGFAEVISAFNVNKSGTPVTDHGDLAGLLDDDHPQYTLDTDLTDSLNIVRDSIAAHNLRLIEVEGLDTTGIYHTNRALLNAISETDTTYWGTDNQTLQEVTDEGEFTSTSFGAKLSGSEYWTKIHYYGIEFKNATAIGNDFSLLPNTNRTKTLHLGSNADDVRDWDVINFRSLENNFTLGDVNVSGAVKLSTPNAADASGMIKWTGTDFEGYDGSAWDSFTDSGTDDQAISIDSADRVFNVSMEDGGNVKFEDKYREVASIVESMTGENDTKTITALKLLDVLEMYVANDSINAHVTGAINGSNDTFTTAIDFVPGTTEVAVNGVKQIPGLHYTESSTDTIIFEAGWIPETNENIRISYKY